MKLIHVTAFEGIDKRVCEIAQPHTHIGAGWLAPATGKWEGIAIVWTVLARRCPLAPWEACIETKRLHTFTAQLVLCTLVVLLCAELANVFNYADLRRLCFHLPLLQTEQVELYN